MRRFYAIISSFLVIVLMAGCTQRTDGSEEIRQLNEKLVDLTSENKSLKEEILSLQGTLQPPLQDMEGSLLEEELLVICLLKDRDMRAVADSVHPEKGVTFSPYGYVDVEKDLNFTADQAKILFANTEVMTWGNYDGTGDPITLNFSEYFERFVYDKDYQSPHIIGINSLIGTGNTLVNIATAYSDASFVEFHFTGFDPQFAGIDWKSLILVLEKLEEKWYLVGIIHNEWTI